jgi:AcrR family transcriptional regulator
VPKVVDHAMRRRELAQAAVRVIGRDGMNSATTRAVALEAGWSTGVLKHYFVDKDQLLHEALREVERINVVRFESARTEPDGHAAVVAVCHEILGGDLAETRVWFAFMNRASVHPPTARALDRAIEAWIARWAELVAAGQRDGSIRPELEPGGVAAELHALVNGLRLAALLRTPAASTDEGYDPATRLALLDALVPATRRSAVSRAARASPR